MATDIEVRSFKCDLQNYKLLKEQLTRRQEELEQVEYLMQGVSSINLEKIGRTESLDSSSNVIKYQKRKDFIEQDIERITERIRYVDDVLERMNDGQAKVIRLLYFAGMTYFELGQDVGYSPIQLKRIVNRIIRKTLDKMKGDD